MYVRTADLDFGSFISKSNLRLLCPIIGATVLMSSEPFDES